MSEVYKKIKLLGEGSFGKAFLCLNQLDDSYCVIKQMDMQLMSASEQKETIKES